MIRLLNLLIIFSFLVFYSNSCLEKTNDIHILISNLEDAVIETEMSLRIKFYSYIGDRVKRIGNILKGVKNLQNILPSDLCKYESVDVGLSIVHSMNNFIDTVRKNVLYAIRSSLDDVRDDQSNSLANFIIYIHDFIDTIGLQSKSLFNDGKGCVMKMEGDIKMFMDVGSKEFMECLQNVSISHPIIPKNFKTYQDDLTLKMRTVNNHLRQPFYYVSMYTTTFYNDTQTKKFNDVSIPSIYDSRSHSQMMFIKNGAIFRYIYHY